MVASGRPSATAAPAGISGAAGGIGGGASGGTTGGIGGGASGGTTGGIGGGANGGTTGGIGGGANGGTTGGIGGGANGGTTGGTGGGASGPGKAIGTPDISEIGAQATAPAGTSPADVWRHSYPPACATPGLNAKAMPHSPAPTAATLMLSRSTTAIRHQLPHSLSKDPSIRWGNRMSGHQSEPPGSDVVNLSLRTTRVEDAATGRFRMVTLDAV